MVSNRNTLTTGYILQDYKIEQVLGQGGFGITYLVFDEKLERKLAIKEYFPIDVVFRDTDCTVHPSTDDDKEIFEWGLERFLDEGKVLAKFKHPNIVRVVGFIEQNNTAYIVMEYERGEDLQRKIKNRNILGHKEVLEIFLPITKGLSLVHDTGYIHRDIKPANILISDNKIPLLIDFGSARQGVGGKTKTLTTLVSPGYAPFEQYNSDANSKQGPWTDIYALSASMYRCLFGASPDNAMSRAEQILSGNNDPILKASYLNDGTHPDYLIEAIDAGLEFRAGDRPQSINDWLAYFPEFKYEEKIDKEEETIKLPNVNEEKNISKIEIPMLKLAITNYIAIGMLTLWAYTSFMLIKKLKEYIPSYSEFKIDNKPYLFTLAYLSIALLILSWMVPNVFLGQVLGEDYVLKAIFISSLTYYINTSLFILWFMRWLKKIDFEKLGKNFTQNNVDKMQSQKAHNGKISEWEKRDNHVMLFLIIILPIIFSPYYGAKVFYSGASSILVTVLPIIIMLLGGVFHTWGTRLLINCYNFVLIE